jgi:hypothetical protein
MAARVVQVTLPTPHPGQIAAFNVIQQNRYTAVRCGRRYGKTALAQMISVPSILAGKSVGWFVPEYKYSSEAFNEIVSTLGAAKTSSSKVDGVIRTVNNGRMDFWTLDNPDAGRSRKYHLAIIDEAAFTGTNMMGIWEKAIQPTLLDYKGKAVALSNANGIAADNFLYQICKDPKYRFAEYHGPTHQNPHMPADELERLEADLHPLVWRQEYLAEFVDFGGISFFASGKLLNDDGAGVEYPTHCDLVTITIDTAVKSGSKNDATAAMHWALTLPTRTTPARLVLLDWDMIQIDAALLETWIPGVMDRQVELAKQCGARRVDGAWIEDTASGPMLISQTKSKGFLAQAIPSQLGSKGKDGRAILAGSPVHRGEVKFSQFAFQKVMNFKRVTQNHAWTQVTGFKIGDKDAATRADDLLDTFCYGAILNLVDRKAYA